MVDILTAQAIHPANTPGACLLKDVTPAAVTVLQDQFIFNVVNAVY